MTRIHMERNQLKETLIRGTLLISRFLDGQCSFRDFVRQYDNFYYYEALDGHEATEHQREVLQRYRNVVSLHKNVQMDVVDVAFLGPEAQERMYLAAGRIDATEAEARLRDLCLRYDINSLLETLQHT